jgi:hypothetical protein
MKEVREMNKFLCMILAAAFCLLMPVTIFADTLTNENENWTVTYNSKGLSTNFKGDVVSSTVKDAMPGDTIKYVVSTQNSKSGSTDWYLSNSVLQSLEDKSDASDGAYSYTLSYISSDGTTSLYDSTVGGDNSNGLMDVNSTTNNNYFYLGRLSNGQSGQVVLEITLDGNTQANDYMNTIADLQMNFAVEEVVNSVVTLNNTVTQTVPGNIVRLQNPAANTDVLTGPKTGDTILPMILSGLGMVVGILLVVIWGVNSRNRKTAKEEAIL